MTSSPNHVLYISCPSATSFLFSFVASFVVFDVLESSLNWFFTLIAFDKKGNAVPTQTRVIFWPDENKLARVNKLICFLDHSVHDHNFKSPWLWDFNCGNSYISLVIF